MSLPPPGANGTMTRTVFVGYVCASEETGESDAAATSASASCDARTTACPLLRDFLVDLVRIQPRRESALRTLSRTGAGDSFLPRALIPDRHHPRRQS